MTVHPIPEGHRSVTPYLVVPDGDAEIRFLREAFGATVHSRLDGPDGRLMHADLQIGDSRVMLGEANDEWNALRAMIHLYVEDVDESYRRALAAGAESVREVETMPYGDRSGGVRDAAGNQWWIATHVEDVSMEELERRMAGAGDD